MVDQIKWVIYSCPDCKKEFIFVKPKNPNVLFTNLVCKHCNCEFKYTYQETTI